MLCSSGCVAIVSFFYMHRLRHLRKVDVFRHGTKERECRWKQFGHVDENSTRQIQYRNQFRSSWHIQLDECTGTCLCRRISAECKNRSRNVGQINATHKHQPKILKPFTFAPSTGNMPKDVNLIPCKLKSKTQRQPADSVANVIMDAPTSGASRQIK